MFAVFRSTHASGWRLNEDTVSGEFWTSPERRMSLGLLSKVAPPCGGTVRNLIKGQVMVTLKALVVDDSGVMRKMVMKGLTESKLVNFEFIEAVDGQDALTKFDPKEIDIGFIDWNMPNMTGVEFVREIRNQYGGGAGSVPLVMVTSEKTMGKIQEALDVAGADAFICKPFTVVELQTKLKKTVERAGVLRLRKNAAEKRKQQPSGGLLAGLFG